MKKGQAPTPAALQQAKLDFKAPKLTFMEMVAPMSSFYCESVIQNAKAEPGIKTSDGSENHGRPAPIIVK